MLEEYIKFLQQSLVSFNPNILVCAEDKVDYDTDKTICIVRQVGATNYIESATFELQLEILTKQEDRFKLMADVMTWSMMQNQRKFKLGDFDYCKQVVGQPVVSSNFVQVQDEYISVFQLGITLIASFNGIEIQEIYVDNEAFNPIQIVLSYSTTPDTQRNNIEEINSTNINESALQISMTNIIPTSKFSKKIRDIMFGKLSKNEDFNVKIIWTDDVEYEMTFKLLSNGLASERSAFPSNTVVLIH